MCSNTADYDAPPILVVKEGRIVKVALNSLKIGYVIAEYPYLDEF